MVRMIIFQPDNNSWFLGPTAQDAPWCGHQYGAHKGEQNPTSWIHPENYNPGQYVVTEIRIEEEKRSSVEYDSETRAIFGIAIGSGTLVAGLVLCILGKLLWKKFRPKESLSEDV